MASTLDSPVPIAGGGPTDLVLASVPAQDGVTCGRTGGMPLRHFDLHIAWSGATVSDAAAIIGRARGAA